jgi:hypothetical protein
MGCTLSRPPQSAAVFRGCKVVHSKLDQRKDVCQNVHFSEPMIYRKICERAVHSWHLLVDILYETSLLPPTSVATSTSITIAEPSSPLLLILVLVLLRCAIPSKAPSFNAGRGRYNPAGWPCWYHAGRLLPGLLLELPWLILLMGIIYHGHVLRWWWRWPLTLILWRRWRRDWVAIRVERKYR